MIAPAGIIQRIAREPTFRLEYLERDGDPPTWTTDRELALFFPRYHDAHVRAEALGGRPIFAIVVAQAEPAEPWNIPSGELLSSPPARSRAKYKPRHRIPGAFPTVYA